MDSAETAPRVSNRSCNRITRSILSSYSPVSLPSRNVLIFLPYFIREHFHRSGRIQPVRKSEIRKKIGSANNLLRASSFDNNLLFFLSFFLLFHPLLFSTSFLNRTSQWRSPALVTIKFHVFPFMKFLLSCRATLHDSPVCRLYYVFVLLYRPVPIYTKQYFSSSFFSPGNTIETIRATC